MFDMLFNISDQMLFKPVFYLLLGTLRVPSMCTHVVQCSGPDCRLTTWCNRDEIFPFSRKKCGHLCQHPCFIFVFPYVASQVFTRLCLNLPQGGGGRREEMVGAASPRKQANRVT